MISLALLLSFLCWLLYVVVVASFIFLLLLLQDTYSYLLVFLKLYFCKFITILNDHYDESNMTHTQLTYININMLSLEQKPHIFFIQPCHRPRIAPDSTIEHQPFLLLQVQNPLLNGVSNDEACGVDRLVLANAVCAINSLQQRRGEREAAQYSSQQQSLLAMRVAVQVVVVHSSA